MNKLIKLKDLAEYLNVSLPTIWRLRQSDDSFPKGIYLGKSVLFKIAEIDEYIESKKES
mgnify:CR=1 FL=1